MGKKSLEIFQLRPRDQTPDIVSNYISINHLEGYHPKVCHGARLGCDFMESFPFKNKERIPRSGVTFQKNLHSSDWTSQKPLICYETALVTPCSPCSSAGLQRPWFTCKLAWLLFLFVLKQQVSWSICSSFELVNQHTFSICCCFTALLRNILEAIVTHQSNN